jgi:hypothetical protein
LVTLLGFKVDDSGREQYNKGIDQTKQKQQSLTASFLKAQVVFAAAQKAVGAAFSFVRDSVIGATAETERYRVTLGTMMGDQEKANKIIHDLDYSPVSDFYGTANAIGGLQGMVTFGMQAEEASDILTRIGDIAQGNSEAFVSMSNNMGQVFAKGKADATDLKQFVMQGFDVVGEVSKQSGKSREEIQKAGVTYEQTAAALRALTSAGGKYEGMLAKQMNTLGGVLKQFASFKAATAEAIGTGVSNELKDMLKYLLDMARAGQDTFVGTFVKVIKEVIHWIFQIMIMFEVLGYRIGDMGDALAPVKQFFSDLREAAGDALTGIMHLIVELGKLIAAAFKPIQAFASPIIRELGGTIKDVFIKISEIIRSVIPAVENSAGVFGLLGNVIAGLIRPALGVAAAVKSIAAAVSIGKGVAGGIKAVQTAYGLLTGTMSVMKAASEGNRLALLMLDAQMLKSKITTVALTVVQKAQALASKIAAAAQWALNAAMNANPIALIILAVIALIALVVVVIKNWDKIKTFFIALGKKIAGVFTGVVSKIKSVFSSVISWIKSVWGSIAGFFAGLWEGIVATAMFVWETLKGWFGNLVESIKGIWNGIKDFFAGLWEAIKQGPSAAIEYIKNAFFGLFNSIQEKLFGFLNKIKEGWESVKGWFGDIAGGVVNFFTGGDSADGAGGMQPAYAGVPPGAMERSIGATSNYAYTNTGGSSTVNAATSINVNVPPGTSQEQSDAIARQVSAQFDAKLAAQIDSSRADIPSPEVRRR